MKLLIFILAALLLVLQYELWFSHNGVAKTFSLKKELTIQAQQNKKLHDRSQLLAEQIYDLKKNKMAIGELAREKLGMIKKGEVYYRVIEGREGVKVNENIN
jgi:cell division protein FtsB